MKKFYLKNKNGITLVALVITIILLLILAGISIATLTGSGLFEKARLAEQKSKNAQELEDARLGEYENKIKESINWNKKPEHANIVLDKEEVDSDETINATVTMTGKEIEIDIQKSKYIINQTAEEIGVDSEVWNSAETFTSNPQTISITKTGPKTYYLHVLSIYKDGKKIETVSKKMRFNGTVIYMDTKYFGRTDSAGPQNFTTIGSTSTTRLSVNAGKTGYVVSKEMYDITDIKKLRFYCHSASTSSGGVSGLVSFGLSKTKDSTDLDVKTETTVTLDSTDLNMEQDVSELSGSYYIKIVLEPTGLSSGSAYLQQTATIKGI